MFPGPARPRTQCMLGLQPETRSPIRVPTPRLCGRRTDESAPETGGSAFHPSESCPSSGGRAETPGLEERGDVRAESRARPQSARGRGPPGDSGLPEPDRGRGRQMEVRGGPEEGPEGAAAEIQRRVRQGPAESRSEGRSGAMHGEPGPGFRASPSSLIRAACQDLRGVEAGFVGREVPGSELPSGLQRWARAGLRSCRNGGMEDAREPPHPQYSLGPWRPARGPPHPSLPVRLRAR